MSSGVNCPFIETDSIQNVCQQNLKKKKKKNKVTKKLLIKFKNKTLVIILR